MIERFLIKWILKNRVPIPCDDLLTWARWMDDPQNRILAVTDLEKVSHLFGRPFRFRESLEQDRYSTWQEAEEGHARACEVIRQRLEEARKIGMTWSKNEKRNPDES